MTKKYRWYGILIADGQEQAVRDTISEGIRSGEFHSVSDVFFPMYNAKQTRRGEIVDVKKKMYYNYLFVKMIINDDDIRAIKSIPKVINFLGYNGKPTLISDKEIEAMANVVDQENINQEKRSIFNIDDKVSISQGSLNSFVGTVSAIDKEKNKAFVSVKIFGRTTEVALDFADISKIDN